MRREGRGGVDRPYHRYEPGFGAVLLKLAHSRNLTWTSTAKALYAVTGGRIYLSPSTIGGIGRGTVKATPELVAGLAGVLGIPTPDLAALGGIHLPDDLAPLHSRAADLATVIWETRRLTTAQLQDIELTSRHLAGRCPPSSTRPPSPTEANRNDTRPDNGGAQQPGRAGPGAAAGGPNDRPGPDGDQRADRARAQRAGPDGDQRAAPAALGHRTISAGQNRYQ
ncbi:hypothetical protein F7Q99_29610 [Streptomyces kaniharaensis]|uniref:Uncharacterized protein n=1 Tax=Streptomyces kaniharaensis TaxID=212423 RepID=A0A6N7KX80_9ACTN|nr:hypothetical protein [Streptomyces kaniharaensis]MQS16262.1 hypothetical protein [Streptomyces kaniharaensis]